MGITIKKMLAPLESIIINVSKEAWGSGTFWQNKYHKMKCIKFALNSILKQLIGYVAYNPIKRQKTVIL